MRILLRKNGVEKTKNTMTKRADNFIIAMYRHILKATVVQNDAFKILDAEKSGLRLQTFLNQFRGH